MLIVQNKIDDIENNNQEEPTSDEAIKKYAVKKDYHLSIKEAYNQKNNPDNEYNLQFRIFKKMLIKTLHVTAKGREIQVYIANVRDEIREHAEENIWNWQQYKDFCYKEAKAEMTDERMKILTQYLHDTGVILYYGYNEQLPPNSNLRKNVFINPSYVTKTIYNILNYKVQDNKGKFTKQQVTEKFQNKEKAETFIALMLSPNFELIFKSKQEAETYYATQYLHEENPEKDTKSFKKLSRNAEIALVIYFPNFFSLSIINRFIARYGIDVKDNIVWKYGIIFEQNDIDVFVECKFKEQKIFVKTDTNNKTHFLIKEIFDTFAELSDNSQSIELSLNENKKGFSLQQIKQNPEKYPEYKFLTSKNRNIMIATLSKEQFKEFQNILMDIYRTPDELTIFVRTALGENRHSFAGSNDLQNITFKLINWAEAKGRLQELIEGTLKENKNNNNLTEFAKNINLQTNFKNARNSSQNRNINQFGEKSIYIEKNEGNININ